MSQDSSRPGAPRHGEKQPGRLSLPLGVRLAELTYVAARRQAAGLDGRRSTAEDTPLGIALSGGGIRSATFSMGVLQRLAEADMLKVFDYMSTVSGGGYMGACLSSNMSHRVRAGRPGNPARFEEGEAPRWDLHHRFPLNDRDQIHHLRTHGDFLIPNRMPLSRDMLRAVGSILGGTMATLALYVCGLTAALGAIFLYWGLVGGTPLVLELIDTRESWARVWQVITEVFMAVPASWVTGLYAGVWGAAASLVGASYFLLQLRGARPWWRDRRGEKDAQVGEPGETPADRRERRWLVTFTVVTLLTLVASLHGAWVRDGELWNIGLARVMLPAAFFLGGIVTMSLLYGAYLIRRKGRWTPRGRSTFAAAVGILLVALAIAIFVALLPVVMSGLRSGLHWKVIAALGSLVLMRLGTPEAGRVGLSLTGPVMKVARALLLKAAVPVFVLATLLVLAQLALMVQPTTGEALAREGAVMLAVGLLATAVLGVTVDYNRISPHYFYRDRLAETYLRTDRRHRGLLQTVRDDSGLRLRNLHGRAEGDDPRSRGAAGAQELMDDFAAKGGEVDDAWLAARGREIFALVPNPAPYHLVVCALNLAGSRDLARRNSKSDHFIMSRLFCGSNTTGYVPTDAYHHGSVKLSRAMAISGAAAASGMGVYTGGAQAFAMTLFNLRLGSWMPNPRRYDTTVIPGNRHVPGTRTFSSEPGGQGAGRLHQGLRRQIGDTRFWPLYLFKEMVAWTNSRGALVNLSDGGHTGDNLGIVPLLQRRCRVILAVDASADGDRTFVDLAAAIRQAFVDENIVVEIDLSPLRPHREGAKKGQSDAAYVVGRIYYPDATGALAQEFAAEQEVRAAQGTDPTAPPPDRSVLDPALDFGRRPPRRLSHLPQALSPRLRARGRHHLRHAQPRISTPVHRRPVLRRRPVRGLSRPGLQPGHRAAARRGGCVAGAGGGRGRRRSGPRSAPRRSRRAPGGLVRGQDGRGRAPQPALLPGAGHGPPPGGGLPPARSPIPEDLSRALPPPEGADATRGGRLGSP